MSVIFLLCKFVYNYFKKQNLYPVANDICTVFLTNKSSSLLSALSKLDQTQISSSSSSASSTSNSSQNPLVVAQNLLNDNDDGHFDKENTTTFNKQIQNASYLSSLVKEQLKIECRKRGLKTKGNRSELVILGNSLIIFIIFFNFT